MPAGALNQYRHQQTKLLKIIKSSERVQMARKMFYLQKNEVIVYFIKEKTTIHKNNKSTTKKLIKGVESDEQYFTTVVQEYVRKEIKEYFKLSLTVDAITIAIFFTANFTPEAFVYFSGKNKKGVYQINIHLLEVLNPASQKRLFQKLKNDISRLRRSDEIKDLKTQPLQYRQTKSIVNFDEKFELFEEYQALKIKYGKIPTDEFQKLLSKARIKLNKHRGSYTRKEFGKTLKDFQDYYYND